MHLVQLHRCHDAKSCDNRRFMLRSVHFSEFPPRIILIWIPGNLFASWWIFLVPTTSCGGLISLGSQLNAGKRLRIDIDLMEIENNLMNVVA